MNGGLPLPTIAAIASGLGLPERDVARSLRGVAYRITHTSMVIRQSRVRLLEGGAGMQPYLKRDGVMHRRSATMHHFGSLLRG